MAAQRCLTDRIAACAARAMEEKIFSGCVIGVTAVGTGGFERKIIEPFGAIDYASGARKMQPDSVFDVASVTKSIPTATLALMALEQAAVCLTTPVANLLPQLACEYAEEITLRHLLTQTLSFNLRLSLLRELTARELLTVIFTSSLTCRPGASFDYCNTTSILLGLCVEKIFGKPLHVVAHDLLFRPLGMTKTCFYPDEVLAADIVPTEIDPTRGGALTGRVHDESAWVLQKLCTPGSAGLFSTVPDLLIFMEMMLRGGRHKAMQILKPQTIQQASTNMIADIEECAGLGWELNQNRYMGRFCSQKTIGKTGFTGCAVMADLDKNIAVAICANYCWPRRKTSADQINSFRRDIADIVFSF
ncbi:MAG: beta-lactamase family protein [Chitinivibrionales bacterium]|nr:beta-lactamase family protein [Chitinivibrionales bacterium]